MRQQWNHNPPRWTQPCPPNHTMGYVMAQVQAWDGSQPWQHIHPRVAMRIAAWYQSGSDPAIASFAASGTITDTLLLELSTILLLCEPEQVAELRALLAYVRAVEPASSRKAAHSGR